MYFVSLNPNPLSELVQHVPVFCYFEKMAQISHISGLSGPVEYRVNQSFMFSRRNDPDYYVFWVAETEPAGQVMSLTSKRSRAELK